MKERGVPTGVGRSGVGGEEESGTSQNSQLQHMDDRTVNFEIELSVAGKFLK